MEIPANEANTGDVIVYRNGGNVTHAGIILGRSLATRDDSDTFEVLSKWGAAGEYEHASRDVPEIYGPPTEYWTDRRMP